MAEKLREIPNLEIKKMDGDKNEHRKLQFDEFPTLVLFKKGDMEDVLYFEDDYDQATILYWLKAELDLDIEIEDEFNEM